MRSISIQKIQLSLAEIYKMCYFVDAQYDFADVFLIPKASKLFFSKATESDLDAKEFDKYKFQNTQRKGQAGKTARCCLFGPVNDITRHLS